VTAEAAELERFVRLCSPLTGFTTYDLHGTGMARRYLDTCREQIGPAQFAEFLDAWEAAHKKQQGPFSLKPVHREAARAVIYFWYTGAFPRIAPAAHAELRRQVPNEEFIPEPSSYVEGLVWRSFNGHPAGAKPPGHGTWAYEPEPVPTAEEIREELATEARVIRAAGSPATPPPSDMTEYGTGLAEERAPEHLLPGLRVSRDVPPCAVPAAADAPDADVATADSRVSESRVVESRKNRRKASAR
jgi:hypothetical protein